MPQTPRVFLIDATAFCYRAFYAIRGLATSSGQPTNAVYGFLRMFLKVLKDHKPQMLAVCFDVAAKTFRHEKDAQYKSNRPPMPDDLSSQIPVIKQVIAAYGIPIFEQEGFEADDVIATLAHKAAQAGYSTTVISQDKDLLQLVDEHTSVVNPQKAEDIRYDAAKVEERFGLKPQQIADFIALTGDAVDNIPGIRGVSEKKAVELLREFGSLEAILRDIEQVKPEKVRAAIQENCQRIQLNRELSGLDRGLDLDFSADDLKVKEPDYEALFKLFKTLEFKALLKDLPVRHDTPSASADEADARSLRARAGETKELLIAGRSPAALAFGCAGRVVRFTGALAEIQDILADPDIKKSGHDVKTLKHMLARSGVKLHGLVFDTMIAAYLLDPAKPGYSLADIAWEFLQESVRDEAIDGAQAVVLLEKLKPVLEVQLKEKSLDNLFRTIELPLVDVLFEMEAEGIAVDTGLLKRLSVDLEKRLSRLIEEIYADCGCEFNLNSPKQLSQVLFERLKLPVIKKTKTGASTDEEVLRKLAAEHALPKKLLEYRQLSKLKTTYIDALPQLVDVKTNRIHTSFNQTGTETGRLSSSNPNLQNLPTKTELGRRIREAIKAFSEDSVLLSCDYSQIELRVLAHFSRDEALVDAFKHGKDIHRRTAALVHGVGEKDVTDQMRDSAKRINFGIIYGLSAFGLSRDMQIGIDQAQGFIDAYFASYPGVKDYIDRQIKRAEEDGFVTTISGRRRYLPDIKAKNMAMRQFAQRQAVNTPIQGSASDLIKLAMVNIQALIKDKKTDARMILQVHDELVFDVGVKSLASFAQLARQRMEEVMELDVPVKVDVKSGKNWSQMKDLG